MIINGNNIAEYLEKGSDNMKEHQSTAIDLFYEGYNCSQATFVAFADLLDADPDEMARISSSFGGGMGKMGEVCGALTGAFMALGAKLGYDNPKDKASKAKHYDLIKEVAERFKAEKGSICCRELLKFNEVTPGETSREPGKQCEHFVGYAANLVDEVLMEHNND
jgi:C_GCAxxG_C_C family probable redox protein